MSMKYFVFCPTPGINMIIEIAVKIKTQINSARAVALPNFLIIYLDMIRIMRILCESTNVRINKFVIN